MVKRALTAFGEDTRADGFAGEIAPLTPIQYYSNAVLGSEAREIFGALSRKQ